MSETWLSPEEIIELTEAKRRDVQCRRLAEMGVPFQPSYGGRPLVERAAVLKFKERATTKKPAEPNWDALHEMVTRSKNRRGVT